MPQWNLIMLTSFRRILCGRLLSPAWTASRETPAASSSSSACRRSSPRTASFVLPYYVATGKESFAWLCWTRCTSTPSTARPSAGASAFSLTRGVIAEGINCVQEFVNCGTWLVLHRSFQQLTFQNNMRCAFDARYVSHR